MEYLFDSKPECVVDYLLNEWRSESAYLYIAEESRVEYLTNRYSDQIKQVAGGSATDEEGELITKPETVVKRLAAIDPTTSGDKAGSYTEWLLKQYISTDGRMMKMQDRFKSALEKFHANKDSLDVKARDINQYKDPVSFLRWVDNIKDKRAEKAAKKEYDVVYKGDGVIIFEPKTWEASKYLASRPLEQDSTKATWCTAGDSDTGKEWFHKYTTGIKSDHLYIIFDKDGTRSQMAVKERVNDEGETKSRIIEWRDNANSFYPKKVFADKHPEAWEWIASNIVDVRTGGDYEDERMQAVAQVSGDDDVEEQEHGRYVTSGGDVYEVYDEAERDERVREMVSSSVSDMGYDYWQHFVSFGDLIDGDKYAKMWRDYINESILESPDSYLPGSSHGDVIKEMIDHIDSALEDYASGDFSTEDDEYEMPDVMSEDEISKYRTGEDLEAKWETHYVKATEFNKSEAEDYLARLREIHSMYDDGGLGVKSWSNDQIEDAVEERVSEIASDPVGYMEELGIDVSEEVSRLTSDEDIVDAIIDSPYFVGGQELALYDNIEHVEEVDGETLYVYQTE